MQRLVSTFDYFKKSWNIETIAKYLELNILKNIRGFVSLVRKLRLDLSNPPP